MGIPLREVKKYFLIGSKVLIFGLFHYSSTAQNLEEFSQDCTHFDNTDNTKDALSGEELKNIVNLLTTRSLTANDRLEITKALNLTVGEESPLCKRKLEESDKEPPKKIFRKNEEAKEDLPIPFFPPVDLPSGVQNQLSIVDGGSFYYSPQDKKTGKKNVIYVFTSEYADQIGFVDHEKRIDMSSYLSESSNENELKEALLIVEERMLELTKSQNLIGRIVYAGQSIKSVPVRFSKHKHEVKENSLVANKAVVVNELLKEQKDNVRMSHFLFNVPPKFLDHFEALVAQVFKVRIFGGVGRIADKKAWKFLEDKYFPWKERIDRLEEKKLINVEKAAARNLRARQRRLFGTDQ